jgi:hypothetical protein
MSGPPKTREPATTTKALSPFTWAREREIFHPLHAVSFVLLLLLLTLLVMLYIGSGGLNPFCCGFLRFDSIRFTLGPGWGGVKDTTTLFCSLQDRSSWNGIEGIALLFYLSLILLVPSFLRYLSCEIAAFDLSLTSLCGSRMVWLMRGR